MGILQKKGYNKGKKLVIQHMRSGYLDIVRVFSFLPRERAEAARWKSRAVCPAAVLHGLKIKEESSEWQVI